MNRNDRRVSDYSTKSLITIWFGVAVVLGVMLTASIISRSPMADVDPAYQRPGFIDVRAPFPAPRLSPSIPKPGVKTVIFFSRGALDSNSLTKLKSFQTMTPDLEVAVVEHAGSQTQSGPLPIYIDSGAALSKSYHFDHTRDGGYPSGYSVIDSHGLVRYTTIDPDFIQLLDEVGTIVKATP